ncbi:MAG: mitofilin family membrane protein, partial [Rickettsiales bacterium]
SHHHSTPAPHGKNRFGFIWRLLVLALLLGYGAWLFKLGGNPFAPAPEAENASTEETAFLQERIDLLEEELQKRDKLLEYIDSEVANLTDRLNRQRIEINDLKEVRGNGNMPPPPAPAPIAAQPPAAQIEASIHQLSEQLTTLQKAHLASHQANQARLAQLSTLESLQHAIARGEAYHAALGALTAQKAAFPLPQSALATLAAHADDGVPTLATLQQNFRESAKAAVPATLEAKENPSLGDTLRSHISGIVSIRKTGEDEEDTSEEAVIARAETALAAGDVETAIRLIGSLSEATAVFFEDWLEQANAYQATHSAVANIKAILMAGGKGAD